MIPKKMERIVNKRRYLTRTATLIASDGYWDGRNWERHGRNRFLYRIQKGNYFLVTQTMWQREQDTLEPISEEEAIALYEGDLSEHEVRYNQAFPDVIVEDALGKKHPQYFRNPYLYPRPCLSYEQPQGRRLDFRTLGADVVRNDLVYNTWTLQGGRLQAIKSGIPSNLTSLHNLVFSYDPVGNVTSIQDFNAGNSPGAPQTQTFSYDALNRLKSAKATGGEWGNYALENCSYDSQGRLSGMPGLGSYGYQSANHIHAVTHLGGVQKYWYGANGNITKRITSGGTYNLAYDAENRLKGVSGAATASYIYDGDGKRVKSVDEYTNLAAGIQPTSNLSLTNGEIITDGDTWANSGTSASREQANGSSSLQYVQLDLGGIFQVDKVVVWHYAMDGRSYHETKTEVSVDGVNWTLVFDSAMSGEYPETAQGNIITFSERPHCLKKNLTMRTNVGSKKMLPYRRDRQLREGAYDEPKEQTRTGRNHPPTLFEGQ